MATLLIARSVVALCALAVCAPLPAQRLQMQYLYDEAKSSLSIEDIQFPSASRGVAVGVLTTGNRERGVALVTSDGGAHWQPVELKEKPLSLFFLNESVGWMVTEKGLWRTNESGKTWTKLKKVPEPAFRVYFTDENTGFAACANKAVLETHDGGLHWTRIPAASEQPGAEETTAFHWIVFATPQFGWIAGSNTPPRRASRPDWLEPGNVLDRRETPHLSLTLQTADGGKTWRSDSASIFGEVTRARFGAPGKGLGLVEHAQSFQYPSEVFELLWPSGKNEIVYRDTGFFVSDIWATPEGVYYLAGTSVASRLRSIVPQKIRLMTSRDLKQWTPIPADYRAVANRVFLAGSGEDLWLATNNGMILKLTK